MSGFPLTRLEINASKNEDDIAYELLRKLYGGKVSFGIEEIGFKGLLITKSQKYKGSGDWVLRTVYEITEYE